MTNMNIYNIVSEIYHDKNKNVDFYKKKYPDFFEHYEVLSTSVFDDTFDFDKFKYLYRQKELVDNNKMSQYDASVKVGSKLVDDYVKPLINKK